MVTPSDVCTTQEAARLLGISVTSVQQLVEAGAIEAWKTRGGHRRIPLAAVQAYMAAPATAPASAPAARAGGEAGLRVLVIEDSEMQRALYAHKLGGWDLALELRFCHNGYQALMDVAHHRPDVVLADIMMEGIDGFEVISTILGYPDLCDIDVAILSGLPAEVIAARGGMPAGIVQFPKPVNFDELRGYLRACLARRARALQQHG